MPTFRHGKNAYFAVVTPSGSTINLSSGLDTVSFDRDVDTAETTHFGDDDRTYLAGMRGATFSASGNFSSTHAETIESLLGASTNPQFRFGPEGAASGRRRLEGDFILTSFSEGASASDKVTMSFDGIVTGAVTSTNF